MTSRSRSGSSRSRGFVATAVSTPSRTQARTVGSLRPRSSAAMEGRDRRDATDLATDQVRQRCEPRVLFTHGGGDGLQGPDVGEQPDHVLVLCGHTHHAPPGSDYAPSPRKREAAGTAPPGTSSRPLVDAPPPAGSRANERRWTPMSRLGPNSAICPAAVKGNFATGTTVLVPARPRELRSEPGRHGLLIERFLVRIQMREQHLGAPDQQRCCVGGLVHSAARGPRKGPMSTE